MKSFDLRKAFQWFSSLNPKERYLVSIAGAAILGYGLLLGYEEFSLAQEDSAVRVEKRLDDLKGLSRLVKRHTLLAAKQRQLEEQFSKSEMDEDQVYSELDRVVKESIGNESYDLKKSQGTTAVGKDSEQQDYTLRIRTATMPQVIQLLYKIEQGKSPLFLGKVDITRNTQPGSYSLALLVSSVQRKKGA